MNLKKHQKKTCCRFPFCFGVPFIDSPSSKDKGLPKSQIKLRQQIRTMEITGPCSHVAFAQKLQPPTLGILEDSFTLSHGNGPKPIVKADIILYLGTLRLRSITYHTTSYFGGLIHDPNPPWNFHDHYSTPTGCGWVYQLSSGMIHSPNSSWNFHDPHKSAQGPPRDLGWHFGHRGRTKSSALPRPPAPHLARCNGPPGATRSTGRPKPPPPACVVGTDLKDRSMMGPKLRNRRPRENM